jgi:hypothetical protein
LDISGFFFGDGFGELSAGEEPLLRIEFQLTLSEPRNCRLRLFIRTTC